MLPRRPQLLLVALWCSRLVTIAIKLLVVSDALNSRLTQHTARFAYNTLLIAEKLITDEKPCSKIGFGDKVSDKHFKIYGNKDTLNNPTLIGDQR